MLQINLNEKYSKESKKFDLEFKRNSLEAFTNWISPVKIKHEDNLKEKIKNQKMKKLNFL